MSTSRIKPAGLLGLVLLVPVLLSSNADRGVLLWVDMQDFSMQAVDLSNDQISPRFRVALGSPAHPTPRGEFPVRMIVRNPSWNPGVAARAAGATHHDASSDGPLGIAKIPLGYQAILIHGGAHRLAMGSPVTLGCVTTSDEQLEELLEWLEQRDTFRPVHKREDGELHQALARPLRVLLF